MSSEKLKQVWVGDRDCDNHLASPTNHTGCNAVTTRMVLTSGKNICLVVKISRTFCFSRHVKTDTFGKDIWSWQIWIIQTALLRFRGRTSKLLELGCIAEKHLTTCICTQIKIQVHYQTFLQFLLHLLSMITKFTLDKRGQQTDTVTNQFNKTLTQLTAF